ncbi:hypothetical protein D2E26_0547 [Bifidobacterium dolichotidis]|uniref:BspA family leucine-rich repeat surface protein n=1 Tax=Bifidobacterium dolichotidis TaxID=2306976 RepID=A0A430FSV6_9BIFI|nr:BspA family leucine-rich repeat surface protein [Bifidobacterium dolichotidis]RSX55984.1 hypothetical protein D2E26_0547 [Bifidobacterium dolichotidis]
MSLRTLIRKHSWVLPLCVVLIVSTVAGPAYADTNPLRTIATDQISQEQSVPAPQAENEDQQRMSHQLTLRSAPQAESEELSTTPSSGDSTNASSPYIEPTYGHWGTCSWNTYGGSHVDIAAEGPCTVPSSDPGFLWHHYFVRIGLHSAKIWNKVTIQGAHSLNAMFSEASEFTKVEGLGNIDFSQIPLDQPIEFIRMFEGTSLESADFDKLNLKKRKINVSRMFADTRSPKIDISYLKIEQRATDISGLFAGNKFLKSMEIRSAINHDIKSLDNVFSGCESLESVKWDLTTPEATSIAGMFTNCKNLKIIDISCVKAKHIARTQVAFSGCHKVHSLYLGNMEFDGLELAPYKFYAGDAFKSMYDLNVVQMSRNAMTQLLSVYDAAAAPYSFPGDFKTTWKKRDLRTMFEERGTWIHFSDVNKFPQGDEVFKLKKANY